VTLPLSTWNFAILNGSSLSPFAAAPAGRSRMMAGIWAEKIDQVASFQNFSHGRSHSSGVFYSIHSLPAFWSTCRTSSVLLRDRRLPLRFLGVSDIDPLRRSGRGRGVLAAVWV